MQPSGKEQKKQNLVVHFSRNLWRADILSDEEKKVGTQSKEDKFSIPVMKGILTDV